MVTRLSGGAGVDKVVRLRLRHVIRALWPAKTIHTFYGMNTQVLKLEDLCIGRIYWTYGDLGWPSELLVHLHIQPVLIFFGMKQKIFGLLLQICSWMKMTN